MEVFTKIISIRTTINHQERSRLIRRGCKRFRIGRQLILRWPEDRICITIPRNHSSYDLIID